MSLLRFIASPVTSNKLFESISNKMLPIEIQASSKILLLNKTLHDSYVGLKGLLGLSLMYMNYFRQRFQPLAPLLLSAGKM